MDLRTVVPSICQTRNLLSDVFIVAGGQVSRIRWMHAEAIRNPIHGHTNAFSVDYEQSRHPSCTKLHHAQMCMQNIDHTLSSDGYDLRYFTHFHFRVIQNNIMDFIDHFWCSDLIWTTWN